MKRVYVQVVDTKTGICQNGSIEEPVIEGQEIANALKHFGVSYKNVEWENPNYGKVTGTYKVVSVIC